ncbi:MAG: dethiobiotin synthase [Planctomycetes bacterium]|nr:dethiobiotin synthase [Planctomycetota bacterium]
MPASLAIPSRGLFVTGTDTGVGKTAAAVAIVRWLVAAGHRVGVYKPVASGIAAADEPGGDPRRLWEAAGRPATPAAVCPQVFPAAIAPARAAAAVGLAVDDPLLRTGLAAWKESDIVVIEGAGGLCSPLGADTLGVDLAAAIGYPIVVVDAARLGAVGRNLATARAARAAGLAVAACVLSHVAPVAGDPADPASDEAIVAAARADLERHGLAAPVVILGHGADVFRPPLDWWRAAG